MIGLRKECVDASAGKQTISSVSEDTVGFRRHVLWGSHVLWAVLTALAIRLVVVGFAYKGFLDPGRNHWVFGFEMGKIANSIVTGHGFGNPYWIDTGPTGMITPVFPYLMSAVFMLFGVYTTTAALVVLGLNALISALTCIPIYLLAQRSFGLQTARAAVWTWALFPYAIYISAGSMWYHSLLTLFVTLLLLAALHLENSARVWMWAGFGCLWGLTALTSPVVLGLLPFLGSWVCYQRSRQKGNWKTPACTAVLALLITMAPWLIRNYRVFRGPIFLKDNFWMEVCVGNLDDATHWWNGAVHPAGNNEELEEFRRLGEQGYMLEKRRQAITFLHSHPGIYLWRCIRRVIFTWTGFWSLNPEYLREEPFEPANIFLSTTFTVLALIGLRKALSRSRSAVTPYALVLLAFPIPYYLTHSDLSYRHPLNPEVVIFASVAASGLAPEVYSHLGNRPCIQWLGSLGTRQRRTTEDNQTSKSCGRQERCRAVSRQGNPN